MAPRRSPGVAYDVLDGQAVLIDPVGLEMLTLNAVGTLVWNELDGEKDVPELANAVLGRVTGVGLDALVADVGAFVASLEDAGLVVVGDGRCLVARITPTAMVVSGHARDPVVAFRRIFATAIAHLLAWHDRHVLHAAAIAVDTGCILVLGGTGAGKSTVALAALRSRWRVLGDDLVALHRH